MKVLAVASFAFLFVAAALAAQPDSVQPPCGAPPMPAYAALNAGPSIAVIERAALEHGSWRPASCTGWPDGGVPDRIAAVSGSFAFDGTLDALLTRAGSVSALTTLRYWSVTEKSWRPLVMEAAALSDADAANRRADFAPIEIAAGATLQYWVRDSRLGPITYRIQVRERSKTRAVLATENATPVRFAFVTLFEASELRSVEFIEQLSPGVFGVYLLTATFGGASDLAGGTAASLVNRAVAIFRHIAGQKSDAEPPAAP